MKKVDVGRGKLKVMRGGEKSILFRSSGSKFLMHQRLLNNLAEIGSQVFTSRHVRGRR